MANLFNPSQMRWLSPNPIVTIFRMATTIGIQCTASRNGCILFFLLAGQDSIGQHWTVTHSFYWVVPNIHHRNLGETSHISTNALALAEERFPEVWILLHRSVTGGLHRHCGASNYWEDTPVAWAWDTRWSTPVTILFYPMFWQMGQQKSLIT